MPVLVHWQQDPPVQSPYQGEIQQQSDQECCQSRVKSQVEKSQQQLQIQSSQPEQQLLVVREIPYERT